MRLRSAMPLDKSRWLAHTNSGTFMMMFVYTGGFLAMGMAEREDDICNNMKLIAVEDDTKKREAPLDFAEVLKLLDWDCDDYSNDYYD